MTLPRELLVAIASAVEAQGGDLADVEDLVSVWERLAADRGGRIDRLRLENEQRVQLAPAEEHDAVDEHEESTPRRRVPRAPSLGPCDRCGALHETGPADVVAGPGVVLCMRCWWAANAEGRA